MSNYEHCAECDALTGRAGKHDDSLYHAHEGPFCVECYENWDGKVIAERDQFKADLLQAAEMIGNQGKTINQLQALMPEYDELCYQHGILQDTANDIKKERDQLKAEVERLATELQQYRLTSGGAIAANGQLCKQLDEAHDVIGIKNARIAEFAERHLKDFAELERLDKQLDEARGWLVMASDTDGFLEPHQMGCIDAWLEANK